MFEAGGDLRRWSAALLLAAVIVGFYWKLVLTDEYTWLAGSDTARQILPWYQFQASEWHKGRIPLWDPNHSGGQPLIGQAQPGVAYPLNWVLFSLSLRDGWIKQYWLHWYFVVIHLMAAWFAFLLAREMGSSRMAGVFCGAVFSLAGWMGMNEWPQMLNGAVWAPLVFLFLLRVLRSERVWASAGLGGFFLGVAWLSGHHQIPIFVSLAAAGLWIWKLTRRWRTAGACALFWVMALCGGALQILPGWEYGKLAVRWVGVQEPIGWKDVVPYAVHRVHSLYPTQLPDVLISGLSPNPDIWVGAVVLGLAVIGAAVRWRFIEGRAMTAVGIGGVLFALGQYDVLHGMLYSAVPLVEKARNPLMAVMLFGLAAAALAACGLDALVSGAARQEWVRRLAIGALGVGLGLVTLRFALILYKGWPGAPEDRSMVTALACLLLAGLCAGWLRKSISARVMALALPAVFILEASNHSGYYWPARTQKELVAPLSSLREHGDIAEFLRTQHGLFRVDVDRESITYNFGDWYGIQEFGGYLASRTENLHNALANDTESRKLLGVEFYVGREAKPPYTDEVFRSTSGLKVFRNPPSKPRVFVEPAGCGAESDTWIEEYTPGRVKVQASMGCRGTLVLADVYYPGWVARVDGAAVRVREVHGFLRGVEMDAGRHAVEFRYRPGSVIWGGALTGLAALGAIVLAVAGRRRA